MGKFEEDFLSRQHIPPIVWWRYIDDIFLIWPHSRGGGLLHQSPKPSPQHYQIHLRHQQDICQLPGRQNIERHTWETHHLPLHKTDRRSPLPTL